MTLIMNGKMEEQLAKLPMHSVDAVVTDPPYGISFMAKQWDYDVPTVEQFTEVLRVLKPGGYLLSFSSSRTYHRMAVNVEDAGFEIRDQLMWLYGSGFPKSHNLGKAYDKKMGNEREDFGANPNSRPNLEGKVEEAAMVPGFTGKVGRITKGNSFLEGWGTALKPAHEPIVMARKPLSESTVLDNAIKWGVGGVNVDASRVGTEAIFIKGGGAQFNEDGSESPQPRGEVNEWREGRWPANVLHDGECLEHKEWSRYFYSAKVSKKERNRGLDDFEAKKGGSMKGHTQGTWVDPDGSIRQTPTWKNNHPTLKPVALMSYLIKMVTPDGGTVLDPFTGSGSTGIACHFTGNEFIGVEMDEDYCEIARARIEFAKQFDTIEEWLK